MNLFAFSNIIVGSSAFFCGILSLLKNNNRKDIRLFAYDWFCVVIWSIGAYNFSTTQDYNQALFWWKIAYIGITLVPVVFLHFIIEYTASGSKKVLTFSYALSILSVCASFSMESLFFGKLQFVFNEFYWGKIQGPILAFHTIYFYGYVVLYSFILLCKYYNKAPTAKHTQIKYLLIGAIIGWIAPELMFFIMYGIHIYPLSNLLISIYAIVTTYAIFKHNLMDINIAIRGTILYSSVIFIITILYFLMAYFTERTFSRFIGYNSNLPTLAVLIILLLAFNPIKSVLQKFIDRMFFRGSIDQINEENVKLRDELQKTEKMKAVATFAAGMAHEIKNPLTSIKTFTEYIDKKKDDPDFIAKYKQIIGKEVDRINYIVKELLEFSKPSDLKLQKTYINSLIDETLDLLSNDLISKNIKVEKNYMGISLIEVDPHQMKQVFLNLFLNAKDAMPDGGTLFISTEETSSSFTISITDTGKGIPKEDLKNIFDPFFTKKDGGTGLGLCVVHGIIEKHGGKIKISSKLNTGTTFIVFIENSDF